MEAVKKPDFLAGAFIVNICCFLVVARARSSGIREGVLPQPRGANTP
jgi:hypothetical protein